MKRRMKGLKDIMVKRNRRKCSLCLLHQKMIGAYLNRKKFFFCSCIFNSQPRKGKLANKSAIREWKYCKSCLDTHGAEMNLSLIIKYKKLWWVCLLQRKTVINLSAEMLESYWMNTVMHSLGTYFRDHLIISTAEMHTQLLNWLWWIWMRRWL